MAHPMITIDNATQSKRALLLRAGVRNLRSDADRLGAADVVHQLMNCVMTAQGALHIVDTRLAEGREEELEELEELLNLAEVRVREGRALIARVQSARFPARQPMLRAA
jgi:hypothetical protein